MADPTTPAATATPAPAAAPAAPAQTLVGQAASTPPPAPAAGGATAPAQADAKGEKQTQAQPNDAAKGGQSADQKPEAQAKDVGEVEIKLPEGVRLDEQAMAGVKALAQEHGLKSEAVQKFVDLHLATLKAQMEAQAQQSTAWRKAIETDKDLGGDHLAQTKANVARAFNRFASPKLVEVLEQTGLGNHPELVRLFAAIGAADGEDSIAGTGNGPASGTLSEAEFLRTVMYPNSQK